MVVVGMQCTLDIELADLSSLEASLTVDLGCAARWRDDCLHCLRWCEQRGGAQQLQPRLHGVDGLVQFVDVEPHAM